MPYDRTWARTVYEKYAKMCTRAHQINLCIRQIVQQKTGKEVLITDIVYTLVDSIQAKITPTLWQRYKRLVKKTPLDETLLNTVVNYFTEPQRQKSTIVQLEFDYTST